MAKKKIITIKHKRDLSGKDEKSREDIISSLQSLIADSGWDVLVDIFKANIKVLENTILDKNGISETECDHLRYKREYLLELINKPQEIIEKLQSKAPDTPTYDPYDDVGEKED